MPQVYAIDTACAAHRAIMNRENDAVPLSQWHNYRPRLHTRSLLRHHKFAAREVLLRFRQQNGELQRENMIAVQVLMQAVVIARRGPPPPWAPCTDQRPLYGDNGAPTEEAVSKPAE